MEQQELASPERPTVTSLGTRIMNVFSAPAELFNEVATTPVQKSSWVVPFILSLVLVLVFTYALFTNDTLRNQIYDIQLEGMQQAVESGRMTQAQLERADEQIRQSGAGLFLLIGGGSRVVVLAMMFFGMALALWLAAKLGLKSTAGYAKLLEVTGLVSWIGILGALVTLLLMYALDSLFASPSAALAILESYERQNKLHAVLSHVNIFSIWETSAVGIALAKISGKPTSNGLGVAFALWGVWVAISVLLSFGM
jgi:hypothetical protein